MMAEPDKNSLLARGAHWRMPAGRFVLEGGQRTLIMGILNVTPDSFSDGGRHLEPETAVRRARDMIEQGADIIDVGGESTRPGHEPVDVGEELRRVSPVLERLAGDCPVPLSIDTTKPDVARRAFELGASILNDQWGLQREPVLAELAAAHGAPVILMHNQTHTHYGNIMAEIAAWLARSVEIATAAGIDAQRMIVDPGFGFGKTPEQNLEVLRRLRELEALRRPVLVGTSRKSMIARVLNAPAADDRLEGTAATIALAIANGADIVRVHDVKEMRRVARMTDAVVRPSSRATLAT